jgi:hypothetical protein
VDPPRQTTCPCGEAGEEASLAAVRVARVAPVGVLASVINDVGLRDLLNARLVPDAPAGLTPGAAGARMIRQGLGCAHRPRSWTPPGCAHPPALGPLLENCG